ncbi:hypothetical protein [Burkholderia gladioli]|uniref:hypothetical protein n=1 Tax=Burkholderia gladioli TaxID=28095 RepID=UPI001640CE31|nr:hypothetical protein [Burkholderia gladioli]
MPCHALSLPREAVVPLRAHQRFHEVVVATRQHVVVTPCRHMRRAMDRQTMRRRIAATGGPSYFISSPVPSLSFSLQPALNHIDQIYGTSFRIQSKRNRCQKDD